MGTFHYTIEVGDPQGERFETVEALVDTGASYTTLPISTLQRLGIRAVERRQFRLADDRVVERDIGEALIRVDGRTLVRVVVFGEGEQALLGADSLEGFGLAVDLVGRRLIPVPGLLMGLQKFVLQWHKIWMPLMWFDKLTMSGQRKTMGTFHYTIEVGDPRGERFETVDALVDTGASHTTVPSSLLRRLGVEPFDRDEFVLADGRRIERDLGQTPVRIDGRQVITIVVFGDEDTTPLLGSYTLEGLRLNVDPSNERLVRTPGLLMGTSRFHRVGQ